MEQLFGALEIRITGYYLVETELRKLREKCQARVQMRPVAVHAFKPRIDETECHHRGERDGGVVEHGEFIHEIAVGKVAPNRPRVAFVRQDFLVDSQLVAEERELLLLGFEISKALISENEVERDERGSDVSWERRRCVCRVSS
jgi:hypothetical protein